MGGKTVDCIRIRAPAQGELPTKKKASKAATRPPVAEEMDDEIPFC